MEIRSYFTIMLKRWWIILLVTLAVGVASVFFSRMIEPKYEVDTSLRVVTPLGGGLGDISYQTYYADRLMNTYAQIATSEKVLEEVKTKLSLTKLPEISVKTVPSSEIIVISVVANNPNLAAKVANTLADTIIVQSRSNANEDQVISSELKILTDRQTDLQNELTQVRKDHENLVLLNAQTTAQMGILLRAIQMKEANYQSLQDQYQKAVIVDAVATYLSTKVPAEKTQKILSDNIASLDTELASMRQQYQDLSIRSATYTQQIVSAGQTVQNKASALENLMSQIDSARIANSKRESAQDVMIASLAVPPVKPTGISNNLVIALGFLCGLVGGILLAFLVNMLDTRIDTTDQIRKLTGLPILGRLPTLSHKDRRAPWSSNDINTQRAIGVLCTKIVAIQRSRAVKTVLLTSPNPREGKSLITQAIAEGMAKSNRNILVIDTDWRKSGLLQLLDATPGQNDLLSLLRGECQLENAIQVFSNPRIHYLLSGGEEEDQSSLFQGAAFTNLLQKLDSYDLVIFDSPAMLAVPDAYSLAQKVDGIILVVQRNHTKVEDLESMISQLEDVHSKLLGTIINKVPVKRVSGYYQRRRVTMPGGVSKPA